MDIAFITDQSAWKDAVALSIGGLRDTAISVGIKTEAGRRLRIDISAVTECICFQAVCLIGPMAYIGFGGRLFVINVDTLQTVQYDMDGYFSKLYSARDLETSDHIFSVLASSASELLAFDKDGWLIWKTENLAIDGVLVHEISEGLILGDGEWDPPGGWKPFTLKEASGEIVCTPAMPFVQGVSERS